MIITRQCTKCKKMFSYRKFNSTRTTCDICRSTYAKTLYYKKKNKGTLKKHKNKTKEANIVYARENKMRKISQSDYEEYMKIICTMPPDELIEIIKKKKF